MLTERTVVFQNQDLQLVGMLHEPTGGGKKPGVLFLHGFTGNKLESHRLFVNAARALAKAGYYALRFDFRGSGDSAGDFIEMTVEGEVSDALAAYSWFKANTAVDPAKIAILGFSLGGCVAAHLAPQVETAALVLWSAVADPLQVFTAAQSHAIMRERAQTEGCLDLAGWPIGLPFIEELPQLQPCRAIAEYTGPALILHGSDDQVVPLQNSQMYLDALPTADKEFSLIDGAGHTFNKITWEKTLIDSTVAWMQKKVK